MNFTETLMQDIQSNQWWISVVLVGLLIHFAGSYLKPFVDKWVFKIFRSVRTTAVRRNETLRSRELDILRQSDVKQVRLALSELRHRFLGLFYLVAAIATVIVINGLLKHQEKTYAVMFAAIELSGAAFFITMSLRHWFEGIDDGELLNDLHEWK